MKKLYIVGRTAHLLYQLFQVKEKVLEQSNQVVSSKEKLKIRLAMLGKINVIKETLKITVKFVFMENMRMISYQFIQRNM